MQKTPKIYYDKTRWFGKCFLRFSRIFPRFRKRRTKNNPSPTVSSLQETSGLRQLRSRCRKQVVCGNCVLAAGKKWFVAWGFHPCLLLWGGNAKMRKRKHLGFTFVSGYWPKLQQKTGRFFGRALSFVSRLTFFHLVLFPPTLAFFAFFSWGLFFCMVVTMGLALKCDGFTKDAKKY